MRYTDRLLAQTVRAAGGHSAGLLAVAALDPLARLVLPAALAAAVDAVVTGRTAWRQVLSACAVLAVSTACEAARETLQTTAEARGARALRRRLLHRVWDLGVTAQARFDTGDVLSRVLESTAGAAAVTPALVSTMSLLGTSVGGLVALFLIDVRLGLLFLAGVPLTWWLLRWFVPLAGRVTLEYQEAQSDLSSRFVGALTGLRTIRASGTADRETARILTPLSRLTAAGRGFWAAQRGAAWRIGLIMPVMQLGVLALAGHSLLHGRISHGEMLAAAGYLALATGLLKQTAVFARLARARAGADRVGAVLRAGTAAGGRRPLTPGPGRLELRGVALCAKGRPILRGIDFTVPAGTEVALVGPPDSGASALARVAGGLVPVDQGTVLLDDVPLHEVRPGELRDAIAYAFERPLLVGETLRDALTYTDRPPAAGRLAASLRAVHAEEFTARLPRGLETPVRRLRLSGGEFQRLGLARAACRDARLVILDDALSSVDTVTEARVGTALGRLLADRTRLVVTHRAATAARADLVAWLEAGTLRALAPHAVLLRDPAYRAIFRCGEEGDTASPSKPAHSSDGPTAVTVRKGT
ncbi:ABC transporter transmembrane domain-containing protein [Streptomyces leeuwenhoekii]|uniref:ABC transporter transmembrane domain-containing protein n=1 Tax=Streptomyces leeuwenhoekii TaxID=1437453 RepID=UPI0036F7B20B